MSPAPIAAPSRGQYRRAAALLSALEAWERANPAPAGGRMVATMPKRFRPDSSNAARSIVERFSLHTERPDSFCCYVSSGSPMATVWTGEPVGLVISRGPYHRNNMGARWRAVEVRAAWGRVYYGREWDSHDILRLRARKG